MTHGARGGSNGIFCYRLAHTFPPGNTFNLYRESGDVLPREKGIRNQVVADITTNFYILLAIFFPSVTGMIRFWGARMPAA